MTQRRYKFFRRTRWFKKWVWVSAGGEAPYHALCLGAIKEVDCWYYRFQLEDGDIHNVQTMDVGSIRVAKADLKLLDVPDSIDIKSRLKKKRTKEGSDDSTGGVS